MRRFWREFVVLALVAAWSPIGVPQAAESEGAAATEAAGLAVRDVRVDAAGGGRRVIVDVGRTPSRVRNFTLENPPRLVLDVSGPLAVGDGREARFPVADGVVKGVRAARFNGKLRVVIDLAAPATLDGVRTDGTDLVATIGGAGVDPVAAIDTQSITELPPDDLAAIAAPAAEAVEIDVVEIVPAAMPVAAPVPAPAAVVPPTPRRRQKPVKAPPAYDEEAVIALQEAAALADAVDVAPEPILMAASARVSPPEPERHRTSVPRAANSAVGTQGYRGNRISLDFKDADIQNVLRVLADVSGMNIIATDDVKGKITLHLSDVPWDQALDLVLRTNRLEATQEGNVVRISTIGRLREEREALLAAKDAERDLEPLRIAYQRVNYARADEALIDKVKGVLTDRGSVTFDDRTNTIIIRDVQRGITDAEQLIRELDVQSPQVLIEANIIEATEDFARGLGVQWGYQYNGGPSTGTPTGSNFPGSIGIGGSGLGAGVPAPPTGTGALPTPVPFLADFPVPANFASGFGAGTGSALNLALGSLDGANQLSARITALEEEGKGKVISRPRVITMNNVAATIQSLTILRVKMPSTGTVINTGTGGVAGGQTTATEKINTGITLVVTPQVSADGFVLMNIYAKSSVPDFSRAVDGIPNEISREANSNVLIRDGETVVLGGIFRHIGDDREAGIPYLRDVPGLGWLFKRRLDAKRQEELLVFLTPKVVDAGSAALPPAERLWQERGS
ncbi:MAG: type IV pilus secretin PilQ [bacterium]|nr:type IV pilus secretin PilQ [bacterium]